MKIRNGFVSNSSSSSFLIYGIQIDESDMKNFYNSYVEKFSVNKEIIEDEIDDYEYYEMIYEILPRDFEIYYFDEEQEAFIGKNPTEIPNEMTMGDWKKEINEVFKKLGYGNVGWLEDCRYN